jgi:thiosulfate dehydrogenase
LAEHWQKSPGPTGDARNATAGTIAAATVPTERAGISLASRASEIWPARTLSYQEFRDLANFVSKGQVEMDRYIDRASRLAKGDKTRHATYYTTICAICHGDEGMTIITGLPLGQIARHDPWETLHKIINGHPDEPMPALRVVGMEILTDILAYVQSLPPER